MVSGSLLSTISLSNEIIEHSINSTKSSEIRNIADGSCRVDEVEDLFKNSGVNRLSRRNERQRGVKVRGAERSPLEEKKRERGSDLSL